jgi:hypothetical protein
MTSHNSINPMQNNPKYEDKKTPRRCARSRR